MNKQLEYVAVSLIEVDSLLEEALLDISRDYSFSRVMTSKIISISKRQSKGYSISARNM